MNSKVLMVPAAAMLMAALLVGLMPAPSISGTPSVNGAIVKTRIFNDCPLSTVTVSNMYPSSITITDALDAACFGFANLHNWRFSSDGGATAAVFDNDSEFKFQSMLVISGTGEGEAGLQISPWWSQDVDGRLNVRTTDGEIAAFGGRLPFYSFSAAPHMVRYIKGTPIGLEIKYHPHSLTEEDPATIEYVVSYAGSFYTSGELPFDEGNPLEPYGTWGCLDDARVGAHLQVFLSGGTATEVTAEWSEILYNPGPTATESSTWGNVKGLYR